MKFNILGFGLLFATLLSLSACEDENSYSAPLSRFEVEDLTVTSGDESVTMQWKKQADKPDPESYLITWVSSSADEGAKSEEVDGTTTSYTVEDLTNDVAYTFGVQARYADGLAQMIKAMATPKTTRIPVTDFKATAGDKCVFLSWTEPVTDLNYKYEIIVSENNNALKTLEVPQGTKSLLVSELSNDIEYRFDISAVYNHGRSETLSSSATPGHITAISCLPENPHVFELCKLEYNPAFFINGTISSVQWSVNGSPVSANENLVTMFSIAGKNTVTVEVTFTDGTKASGSIDINVENFAWSEFPNAGYQKASNFAFSADGQTLYSVSQTSKTLFAINAITGLARWQQTFEAATYGAGIAVGPDGKVYIGTEDKNGSLYALTENGTIRWTVTMGAAVKAAPAVTSDGYVYALCDGAKLIAYDADNGNQIWSAQLSGNAGGVVVDANGNVYAGTSAGVWSYSSRGDKRWASEALVVTERGGSLAINSKDNIIYAVLKAKAGIAALDMNSGATKWTYPTSNNDCYHPVVDNDGNVYFCEKNGGLYALTSSGSVKWKYTDNLNYTYSGFALGENGHAYITQYGSPFAILDFDPDGNANILSNITQTMSPVCIGPDGRLYYGCNGSIQSYNIGVQPLRAGWYCCGGNLQGSNSLR